MFEAEHESQDSPETEHTGDETENPTGEEIGSEGGEGAQNADVTPDVDDAGEEGQATVPAPDDDVKPQPDDAEGEPADH
jgi:hypothetical protein